MAENVQERIVKTVMPAVAAGAAALVAVGVAAAATPVRGSISGPVTAVKGKTFTVKTALSPTGSSTVKVVAKTVITTQGTGKRADLKKGLCVTAMGTKKGSAVVAQRISLVAPTGGRCDTGFRGRPGGGNGAQPPANGNGNGNRNGNGGQGFTRPANFGFAVGTVSAVKGSTLTVKGTQGSTKVTVSAKTQITKTVRVPVKRVKVKSCVFVDGTSTDKGVTVTAQDVRLSQPRNGSCTFGFRGRRSGTTP